MDKDMEDEKDRKLYKYVDSTTKEDDKYFFLM